MGEAFEHYTNLDEWRAWSLFCLAIVQTGLLAWLVVKLDRLRRVLGSTQQELRRAIHSLGGRWP